MILKSKKWIVKALRAHRVATAVGKVALVATVAAHVHLVRGAPNREVNLPEPVELKNLELAAVPEQAGVGPDDPVILTVTLKNVSTDKSYSFFQTTPEEDFQVVVKDSQGKPVQLTARGKLMAGPGDHLMRIIMPVKPGQELRYKLFANRLHDMSLSGTYSVSVKQYLSRSDGKRLVEYGFVVSKPVQVTIGEQFSKRLSIGLYTPGPLKPDEAKTATPVGATAASKPTALWKEGDAWPLRVDLLTTAPQAGPDQDKAPAQGVAVEPRLIARYGMRVKVAGTEHTDAGDYWQLDFTPERDAPSATRGQSYRVLVSKKDGSMATIIGLRGLGNPGVERVDGLTFTHEVPFGYPLLVFALGEKREFTSPRGSRFSLATQTTGQKRVLEASAQRQGAKGFTVKQVWPSGAKWWDEYEMQDNDRQLILRAKRG